MIHRKEQTIVIEWRHLDQDGATCDRCAETGSEIRVALTTLQQECGPRGVAIILRETLLAADAISESNRILINGTPLEELLPQAAAGENPCCSCTDLIGRQTSCRTIVRAGLTHEAVPARFIREAICEVARCC